MALEPGAAGPKTSLVVDPCVPMLEGANVAASVSIAARIAARAGGALEEVGGAPGRDEMPAGHARFKARRYDYRMAAPDREGLSNS